MNCLKVALLVAGIFCFTLSAHATVWHVPSQAPTIAAGLNLASAGDEVVIANGIYYEHGLIMKSGVTVRCEAGEEGNVIIDADELGFLFNFDNANNAELLGIACTGAIYYAIQCWSDVNEISFVDCIFYENRTDESV
jgi:hypothetical protein